MAALVDPRRRASPRATPGRGDIPLATQPSTWLSPAAVATLTARGHPVSVRRGEFVFLAGDRAAAAFLLVSGQVKVVRETPDGREVILRLVRAGQLFGLARDWETGVHRATAVALDDARLLRLPWRELLPLVGHHPEIAAALLCQSSARLVEADTRICALQAEPVERRLGEALRHLAATAGTPTAAGIVLDLPLTRQGLGDLCGATESTVSRTLNAWSRRGIIAIDRQRIVLHRPGDLPAHDEGDLPDGRAIWPWVHDDTMLGEAAT